jgi:hypothetical protein
MENQVTITKKDDSFISINGVKTPTSCYEFRYMDYIDNDYWIQKSTPEHIKERIMKKAALKFKNECMEKLDKVKWVNEYKAEQKRGWHAYEALPEWIKTKLGHSHYHVVIHKDIKEEIVYREVDVVDIINMILNRKQTKIN